MMIPNLNNGNELPSSLVRSLSQKLNPRQVWSLRIFLVSPKLNLTEVWRLLWIRLLHQQLRQWTNKKKKNMLKQLWWVVTALIWHTQTLKLLLVIVQTIWSPSWNKTQWNFALCHGSLIYFIKNDVLFQIVVQIVNSGYFGINLLGF